MARFSEADRQFLSRLKPWLVGMLFGIFAGRATVMSGFVPGLRLVGIFVGIVLIAHVIVSQVEAHYLPKAPEPPADVEKDEDAPTGH